MSYDMIEENLDSRVMAPKCYDGITNFMTPDQIVHYCVDRYGLANPGIKVIDPFCGLGTIPRVINDRGGDCLGVEIDNERFQVALTVIDKERLIRGDCLHIETLEHHFHCIFTSLPCEWFKGTIEDIPLSYVKKFKYFLQENGFIILDTVSSVYRDGETWLVASKQCDYFEKHGFRLVEKINVNTKATDKKADPSVILKFNY